MRLSPNKRRVAVLAAAAAAALGAGAGRPLVLRRAEDTDEGRAGAPDPHWWADPEDVEHAVGTIERAYAGADPAGAATYRANAGRYLARLRALDGELRRCIAAVPAPERELVTDHDAFASFVRHYDLTYVGAVIPSTTTQAQPSAGALSRLAATVRRLRVPTLHADTLGPRGSAGATYLGAMRHNADELVRGFTRGARGCP